MARAHKVPQRGGHVGICSHCGAVCFISRKAARRYARSEFPGDHLSAFRCGRYWHFKLLSRARIRGEDGVGRDGRPEPTEETTSPAAAAIRAIWEATRPQLTTH